MKRTPQPPHPLESELAHFPGRAEAHHELFAGNTIFATSQVNHYGTHAIPTAIYQPILTDYGRDFPLTAPMFVAGWPILLPPPPIEALALLIKAKFTQRNLSAKRLCIRPTMLGGR